MKTPLKMRLEEMAELEGHKNAKYVVVSIFHFILEPQLSSIQNQETTKPSNLGGIKISIY